MSKRNVAFIKPKEPAFLARLKEEIGYKEGPTVDTKREALPEYNSDDSEGEEQQPVIVVLNPGDLTAEEVAEAKQEAPADLDKRVIFKKPEKKRVAEEEAGNNSKEAKSGKSGKSDIGTSRRTKSKPKKIVAKGPLSFSEDPEED